MASHRRSAFLYKCFFHACFLLELLKAVAGLRVSVCALNIQPEWTLTCAFTFLHISALFRAHDNLTCQISENASSASKRACKRLAKQRVNDYTGSVSLVLRCSMLCLALLRHDIGSTVTSSFAALNFELLGNVIPDPCYKAFCRSFGTKNVVGAGD